MYRGVSSYVDSTADDARFIVTPEATADSGVRWLFNQFEIVTAQQLNNGCFRYLRDEQHQLSKRRYLLHDDAHEVFNDCLAK